MARKNPVGKLAETALSTLRHPKEAASKVVDQAKGTAALGKVVAGTAGSVVGRAAGRVTRHDERGRGGQAADRPSAPASRVADGGAPEQTANLRAVPDVNEPGQTQRPGASNVGTSTPKRDRPAKPGTGRVPASKKSGAKKSADSPKRHGDALVSSPAEATREAKKAATKRGGTTSDAKPAAKRSSSGTAAAKKAPAKKAPAKKTPAKKAPAKKPSAKSAPAPAEETANVTATPADVAEVVEAAVAEDPGKTAAQPAKKAAKKSAKKSPAEESSPGGKLPPRKSTGEQGAPATDTSPPAAPDTSPPAAAQTGGDDREGGPVVEPAEAKQVASESETLRKAAEKDPS